MYPKSGMFCFVVGFFLTAFAVGGIEQSLTDAVLLECSAIALVGLMIMAAGVMMLKEVDNRYYR
jgi:hypothetical protein